MGNFPRGEALPVGHSRPHVRCEVPPPWKMYCPSCVCVCVYYSVWNEVMFSDVGMPNQNVFEVVIHCSWGSLHMYTGCWHNAVT